MRQADKRAEAPGGRLCRPVQALEGQQAFRVDVQPVVMLQRQGDEVVEVQQRQGDGRLVGLVLDVAGEATGGDLKAAVAGAPTAEEGAHGRRTDRAGAVLDFAPSTDGRVAASSPAMLPHLLPVQRSGPSALKGRKPP